MPAILLDAPSKFEPAAEAVHQHLFRAARLELLYRALLCITGVHDDGLVQLDGEQDELAEDSSLLVQRALDPMVIHAALAERDDLLLLLADEFDLFIDIERRGLAGIFADLHLFGERIDRINA